MASIGNQSPRNPIASGCRRSSQKLPARHFGSRVRKRMYDSFVAIWRGWRRIYLHAFNRKPNPLLMRFLGIIVFSIVPFTSFLMLLPMALRSPETDGFLLGALAALLIFIIGTSWKTYGIVKANRLYAFLHPVGSFFIAMILFDAFWMAMAKKKTVWR